MVSAKAARASPINEAGIFFHSAISVWNRLATGSLFSNTAFTPIENQLLRSFFLARQTAARIVHRRRHINYATNLLSINKAHNQRNQEDYDKYIEKYFSYLNCATCNAAKPEDGGNDGNNKECSCPSQHGHSPRDSLVTRRAGHLNH